MPRKDPYDRDGVDHEHRATLAERHGKVPAGKRLTFTRVGGELEIRLIDDPNALGGRADLNPVVIPEKIGRIHPAAREFRDRTERHEVSRSARGILV